MDVGEYRYKCSGPKQVFNKIWNSDFYEASFNELVQRDDEDEVIATVGKGEVSPGTRSISQVVTLGPHPWAKEVAGWLIDVLFEEEGETDSWSVRSDGKRWIFEMSWKDL